jgi:hypothetical protein
MRYAIIENGKVVNIAVATPEVAAEFGWIECPEGVGIGWRFDGSGEPLPPPPDTEGEAARVRAKRNTLLIESDVMVLPDRWAVMTPEQQTAWATYRQALRDITAQSSFPWEVQWPTQPEM